MVPPHGSPSVFSSLASSPFSLLPPNRKLLVSGCRIKGVCCPWVAAGHSGSVTVRDANEFWKALGRFDVLGDYTFLTASWALFSVLLLTFLKWNVNERREKERGRKEGGKKKWQGILIGQ